MKITLIGLGQVGSSIGLALSKYKDRFELVGFDKDFEKQKLARSIGAVTKAPINLIDAIDGADIIVFCTPYSAVRELFGLIKDDVKADAVILSTTPNKAETSTWFTDTFAKTNQFVGLTLSINAEYTRNLDPGEILEKDDVFNQTSIGISAPMGTGEKALKYASDLVELIGAKVYYFDMLEADGIERRSHLLPQITALSLFNATSKQPGWSDAQFFTNQAYLNAISAIGYESKEDIADLMIANNTANADQIDLIIEQLTAYKNALLVQDREAFLNVVGSAIDEKQSLLNKRRTGNWQDRPSESTNKSKKPGVFQKMLFGERK